MAYVEHILKHFNESNDAIEIYDFLQYCAIKKFINKLAAKLIDGKQTFVFVGNVILTSNSPAKGYRRNRIKDPFAKIA